MEALIRQMKSELEVADEKTRREMIQRIQEMMYSMESSDDTVNRVGYLSLQISAARIGIDMHIFSILSESKGPLSIHDLQHATGANIILLGRLLRYMSSVGLVLQQGPSLFSASQVSKNLAGKGNQGAICHCFETCGPMFQELPGFLRRHNYSNIEDGENTVFQDAFKIKLPAYQWFAINPERLRWFNDYMSSRRHSTETWLSVYDIEPDQLKCHSGDEIYVNIGGGIGQQCQEFINKFPNTAGRVVLQDLSHTIEQALQTPGVRNMAHDFFKPQPVLGAKFYFLRGVLHNWPDEKAKEILKEVVSAMGKESIILIDEPIVPDSGLHQYVAAMDMTMMCALAGIQRTHSQWVSLLNSVGLRILSHVYYKPAAYEGVMSVIPSP
ncbi:S-adenosyl-L-methionine-dependent methyltransferase [Clohesyomyces aquaticus]|uniref:S-adenosyl-L-methionine-dependent methyltransferase n=1 Tax=Clohesyomyces aquaticus TaxID=1231657 RepID=A0A1Y1YWB1_9PLEO|nr:S-adenosyl-L-methionine-dependent methyltransferase [Clohesyomyces aquaticus]